MYLPGVNVGIYGIWETTISTSHPDLSGRPFTELERGGASKMAGPELAAEGKTAYKTLVMVVMGGQSSAEGEKLPSLCSSHPMIVIESRMVMRISFFIN